MFMPCPPRVRTVCPTCNTPTTTTSTTLHLQDLGLEGVFADGTTAAALNSSALQAALAAVAPGVVDRYHASGWQLAFDTDTSVPDINAEKFIREGAMKFTPQPSSSSSAAQQQQGGQDGSGGGSSGGRGTVQVASPVLTSRSVGEIRKMAAAAGKPDDPQSAAMLAAAADPYMVRFLGNWYTKVGGVCLSFTVLAGGISYE